MKENCTTNDKLKQKIAEVARSVGISSVHFVEDSHSKIIQEITCILETEIYDCLKNIKRNLMSQPSQCVTASLVKVNALLQRLEKGAKPYLIAQDEKTVFSATGNKELDTLLKRYNKKGLEILIFEASIINNLVVLQIVNGVLFLKKLLQKRYIIFISLSVLLC